MWPLNILLLFTMAAPQQQERVFPRTSQQQKPAPFALQSPYLNRRTMQLPDLSQSNTCFTMRSYYFRRQDGLAPVPAGTTTCTPANTFRQLQVAPVLRPVPLMYQPVEQKVEEK